MLLQVSKFVSQRTQKLLPYKSLQFSGRVWKTAFLFSVFGAPPSHGSIIHLHLHLALAKEMQAKAMFPGRRIQVRCDLTCMWNLKTNKVIQWTNWWVPEVGDREGGQKVQNCSFKINKPWRCMYSLMIIDNKTVWYIWKLLREKNRKSSHQKKKNL